jgi:putative ABC transport system permease protein
MSAATVGRPVRTLRGLAVRNVRAHRAAMSGTALVMGLAGALVATVGVLLETGLRGGGGAETVVALASSFAGTALVVVVVVVASTANLALRRRRRELALLRAVGATGEQVRRLVATEVVVVGTVAATLGAVPGTFLARLLEPTLRAAGVVDGTFGLTTSPLPTLGAVALLVPTAWAASRLAARESVRLDPTAAIGASATEPATVGPVRRWAAVLTALTGVSAAFSPLGLPGVAGGALAASSAFFLVGAAALAGPELVGWAFGRTSRLGRGGPVSLRLALVNLRGFSRRLTTVVVPLALVLTVATAQSTVDRVVGEAAADQLAAAVGTDLVVSADGGLAPDRVDAVRRSAGVEVAVPVSAVAARVRTDDELPAALAWEGTRVTVVPPTVGPASLDPDVTAGSLADLAEPGTVAISSDAAFGTSAGLGGRVDLELDGTPVRARVVAVFDRGLGMGDYLVGPATASAGGVGERATRVLVGTSSSDRAAVADTLASQGFEVSTTAQLVASTTSPDAAAQHLSSVLTLLLLVLVAVGAATSLVLVTADRRDELRLLHRSGATPRQLRTMLLVESVLTGVLAWAVGTLAVLPAIVGTNLGLLGLRGFAFDLTGYAVVSAAVLTLTVGSTAVAGRRALRRATLTT